MWDMNLTEVEFIKFPLQIKNTDRDLYNHTRQNILPTVERPFWLVRAGSFSWPGNLFLKIEDMETPTLRSKTSCPYLENVYGP